MIKDDTYIIGYKIYSEGIKNIIEEMKERYRMREQINSHITLIYLGKDNKYEKELEREIEQIRQIGITGVCIDFIGSSVVLRVNIEKEQYKICKQCINKYEKAKHTQFLHITLGNIDGEINNKKKREIINTIDLSKIREIKMENLDLIKIDHINNKYINQFVF